MTSVPLNEIWINEFGAKPVPVILTGDIGTPNDLSSVIDGASTVNGADSIVGDRTPSLAVIVALPGGVGGVVIKMTNLPLPSDFG